MRRTEPREGGAMTGGRPPEAWVGREVEATIINAAVYDEYGLPSYLTAHYRVGVLEDVSDLGIVASLWFDPEGEAEEPPRQHFLPLELGCVDQAGGGDLAPWSGRALSADLCRVYKILKVTRDVKGICEMGTSST
jgi:hypothetical protein